MAERRPTNSELKLRRLQEEEPKPAEDRGILELFDEEQADEDLPLARDDTPDDGD